MRWVIFSLLTTCAFAQSFDVATIKPSPPLDSMNGRIFMGPKGGPGSDDPGRYSCQFCDAGLLLSFAYDVPEYRILNATRLPSERYHIVATIPAGATHAQFQAMLRNLLAERFQLQTHTEEREMPLYRVVVASSGLKLKEHVEGAPPPRPDASQQRTPGISFRQQGKTLADFARVLQGQLRKPVEDATGLAGKYDFDLSWSFQDATDSPLPDVFGALQSVGLKLESRKGKVECVVVDRAAKPTEN